MAAKASAAEKKLAEQALKGLTGAGFPAELTDGSIDMPSAFRIQSALLDLQLDAGRTLGGWKSGIAPPPAADQMGDNPTMMGPLFSTAFYESGCSLAIADIRGDHGRAARGARRDCGSRPRGRREPGRCVRDRRWPHSASDHGDVLRHGRSRGRKLGRGER